MPSTHGPETDRALLERHRVADRTECTRLLDELLAGADMVTLYAGDDNDCFVVSQVLAIDATAGEIEFEFTTDDARRTAFVRAGRAVATALLGRVKLQFELEAVLVRNAASGALRLRAPLPGAISRLQRREAYRVEPPTESTARLWLRSTQDAAGERRIAVMDVSATGLGLRFEPREEPAPVIGTVFGRCRLELPATGPIYCDLVVRSVAPGFAGERGSLRVGCEFAGLDPSSARAVQVFVNTAQTRGRRLRPGAGRA
jgi:c-di-GMP-binding flagellar brake protein YcgR